MSLIISKLRQAEDGPNVITDTTFITLGFKMLLRMGLLLRLGPNVITDGTFITLGSNYYTCAFYRVALIQMPKFSYTEPNA